MGITSSQEWLKHAKTQLSRHTKGWDVSGRNVLSNTQDYHNAASVQVALTCVLYRKHDAAEGRLAIFGLFFCYVLLFWGRQPHQSLFPWVTQVEKCV